MTTGIGMKIDMTPILELADRLTRQLAGLEPIPVEPEEETADDGDQERPEEG